MKILFKYLLLTLCLIGGITFSQTIPHIILLDTSHTSTQFEQVVISPTTKTIYGSSGKTLARYTISPLSESFISLPSEIKALSIAPEGTIVLAGFENGSVSMITTDPFSTNKPQQIHQKAVVALAAIDNLWYISGSSDKQLLLVNASSPNTPQKLPAFLSPITTVVVHPSKKYCMVGTEQGIVYALTLTPPALTKTINLSSVSVKNLLFSNDGKVLIVAFNNGQIQFLETDNFTQLASINTQNQKEVSALAIDPQNRWLIIASSDNSFDIYDFNNFSFMRQFEHNQGALCGLFFTDSVTLVSVTRNGLISQWKVLPAPPDTLPPSIVFDYPVHTSEETAAKYYGSSYTISGLVYDDNNIHSLLCNNQPVQLQPVVSEKASIPAGMKSKQFSITVSPDSFGISRYDFVCFDEADRSVQQSFYINRLPKDRAIEILSPAPDAETDLISIPLRFKTWFDIATYSVTVNMADIVSNQEPGFDVLNNEINETIPLLVGYNQVQITVKSTTGETFSNSFGITRKTGFVAPIASGEKKPRSASSGPQRWAVVVGISEYQHSAIPALKYADKDAEAFANFLRRPQGGGFDSDHMRVLLNKDATLANIKDALINFLSQAIDMDLVIIYFAGHGAPEPGRPQNMYLLTYDTNPTALGTTAFPMWDIQTVLARYITAKRVIVFTDACHSGGISVEFATRGLGITESNLVNQYLADLARAKEGVVVFTASAAGEVSQEFPEFGHGVFTYYLLQGMEGKADYNNDYTITINELMQYVEEQVKRKTKGAQNPTRSQTKYDKDMTIAIVPH